MFIEGQKNKCQQRKKEVSDAEKEGVKILFQNNIVKINGTDKVQNIELIKTELVQKEGDTRLSPVNIEGSNYTVKADYVIMALGSKQPNCTNLGLEVTPRNYIKDK